MPADNHTHLKDEEILQRYYEDNGNEWLGILLPRYTLMLLGVCMKYLRNEEDAKDCVQQVFLKVIDELHKYKVTYFKSWIYMVAKNHCLMKLRDKGKITGELKEEIIIADDPDDKIIMAEKEELIDKMERCMQKLSEEQQHCLTLFYLQKKSYSEIADITGFSITRVKSYIQNGKRNLKMKMEGER
ncbi:MAG: sigma-70 family RNA polymerase sigma factor [Ginsengibacter sp.]